MACQEVLILLVCRNIGVQIARRMYMRVLLLKCMLATWLLYCEVASSHARLPSIFTARSCACAPSCSFAYPATCPAVLQSPPRQTTPEPTTAPAVRCRSAIMVTFEVLSEMASEMGSKGCLSHRALVAKRYCFHFGAHFGAHFGSHFGGHFGGTFRSHFGAISDLRRTAGHAPPCGKAFALGLHARPTRPLDLALGHLIRSSLRQMVRIVSVEARFCTLNPDLRLHPCRDAEFWVCHKNTFLTCVHLLKLARNTERGCGVSNTS